MKKDFSILIQSYMPVESTFSDRKIEKKCLSSQSHLE